MAKAKLKTLKSAAKRFKKTGSGRYKHKQSCCRHYLTNKDSKRKRQLRGLKSVDETHVAAIDQMLPHL